MVSSLPELERARGRGAPAGVSAGSHDVRPSQPLAALQHAIGNRATQQRAGGCPALSACPTGGACHSCPFRPQAKLEVSVPGDPLEREADRVAEEVVQRSAPGGPVGVGHAMAAAESRPLDPQLRSYFEPRFGRSFADVRIHTDPGAARSARSMGALAYTAGRDIAFAPGQFAPHTDGGRRLIAHELAHVVQQQTAPTPLVQRQTIDTATCNTDSADGYRSAHAEATTRVEYALRQLNNPRSVSSLLRQHYRLNPSDAGVATVRGKLEQILSAFTGSTNTLHCEPDATCRIEIGRDTNNNPIYRGGYATDHDITFCQQMFGTSLGSRVVLLIHETAHTLPADLPDGPYRSQTGYPGTTPTNNAEAYSEFVGDVWNANRLIVTAPAGVLLSGSEARFAFGVTATTVAARRLFWGLDLTLGASFHVVPDTGEILYMGRVGLQRELTHPRLTIGAWGSAGAGSLQPARPADLSRATPVPAVGVGGGAEVRWNVWDDLDVGVSLDYLRASLRNESDPNRYIVSGNLSWTFF